MRLPSNLTADTVLVHSSFKSLGYDGSPQDIVNLFCDTYDNVLFPTYNFTSWTKEHYFDLLETPSQMGIVTEFARRDKRFVRTQHPIHSFAVTGTKKQMYADLSCVSSFGVGSVLDKLVEQNALMLSIGLDWNDSYTMVHHAEQMAAVSHRRLKDFSGMYINQHGPKVATYSLFARKYFEGVLVDITRAMNELLVSGVITAFQLGEATVHATYAKPFFDAVLQIAKTHPEKLHRRTR